MGVEQLDMESIHGIVSVIEGLPAPPGRQPLRSSWRGRPAAARRELGRLRRERHVDRRGTTANQRCLNASLQAFRGDPGPLEDHIAAQREAGLQCLPPARPGRAGRLEAGTTSHAQLWEAGMALALWTARDRELDLLADLEDWWATYLEFKRSFLLPSGQSVHPCPRGARKVKPGGATNSATNALLTGRGLRAQRYYAGARLLLCLPESAVPPQPRTAYRIPYRIEHWETDGSVLWVSHDVPGPDRQHTVVTGRMPWELEEGDGPPVLTADPRYAGAIGRDWIALFGKVEGWTLGIPQGYRLEGWWEGDQNRLPRI